MTVQTQLNAEPATHRSAADRWLLARLTQLLRPAEISLQPDDLEASAIDRSAHRLPGTPLAVLRPESTESVRAILRVADAARVTVVPRGAGTGLSGGASAPDGALVLSTERLNSIIGIDPDNQLAVVQPGVITADIDAAAAEFGLMYAPDPASHEVSSIGGNIATNAGGLRCAKYGVTRESVLGLTVVLADGTLLRTGRRSIKGVVGYDLTALFVGSEGTLGVVVEATLRLRPRPVATRTAVAFFASTAAAAAGLTGILASGAQPSVLELLDAGALSSIDQAQGTDLRDRGGALIIAQTDGFGAAAEIAAVADALTDAGGTVEHLDDAGAQRYLWLRRHGRGDWSGHWVIGEDVAVPRSALAPMLDEIERIGLRHQLEVAVVAHAGDGNLHPLLSVRKQPDDGGRPPVRLSAAADELVRAAIGFGGTISGEHGVGITKRGWLEAEIGPLSAALQRRLKATFDPRGILNPHTWLAGEPTTGQARQLDISRTNGSHRDGTRLTSVALAAYGDDRS